MNYAPNELFPSNTEDYTLNNTVLNQESILDETDAQIKSFKEKLGLAETSVGFDVPQSEISADISPSRSTMEGRFFRDYSAVATEKSQNAKLSTKQKIAVASYITSVFVLILAITLCTVAISGSFSSMLALENTYSQVASQLETVNQSIGEDNYLELLQKATELGYVPINSENSYSYTVLQTRPAQNFEVESNWFDELCDWLGGLFGG